MIDNALDIDNNKNSNSCKLENSKKVLIIAAIEDGNLIDLSQIELVYSYLKHQKISTKCIYLNKYSFSIRQKLTDTYHLIKQLVVTIENYEIIHIFQNNNSNFISNSALPVILGRFFGKKVILTYNDSLELFQRSIFKHIALKVLSLCDAITVGSKNIEKILKAHNVKSQVIYHSVDQRLIKPKELESIVPKIYMEISEENRSFPIVLKAFKLVKQKYPRTELVILGPESKLKPLQNVIKQNSEPGVSLVNPTFKNPNIKFLEEADIYINNSYSDNLPPSITAALSAGIPVLSIETESSKEFIKDGDNGILYKQYDFVSLADKIFNLVETPMLVKHISTRAKQYADKFSRDNIVKGWNSLYRSILGNS